MPKLDKAKKRDKKSHKSQHGHQVSNRSIFVIQEQITKGEVKPKKNKKRKRRK